MEFVQQTNFSHYCSLLYLHVCTSSYTFQSRHNFVEEIRFPPPNKIIGPAVSMPGTTTKVSSQYHQHTHYEEYRTRTDKAGLGSFDFVTRIISHVTATRAAPPPLSFLLVVLPVFHISQPYYKHRCLITPNSQPERNILVQTHRVRLFFQYTLSL